MLFLEFNQKLWVPEFNDTNNRNSSRDLLALMDVNINDILELKLLLKSSIDEEDF